jgi:hypothetical protein
MRMSNKCVYYCSKRKFFVHRNTNTALKGVHGVLSEHFYPYADQTLRREIRADAGVVHNKLCYGSSDVEHGCVVDADLAVLANQLEGVADEEKLRQAVMQLHRRDCDPCSLAVLRALKTYKWRAIKAQQAVGCMRMRVATAIDLVCQDMVSKERIMVEIKTTRHTSRAFYEQRSPSNVPMKLLRKPDVPFSFCNIDLLQVMLTRALAERYELKFDRAVLIRVGGGGIVWRYQVPRAWIDAGHPKSMCAALEEVETRRQQRKKNNV